MDIKKCIFCGIGKGNMEHYMREYKEMNNWFDELGIDYEENWSNELDEIKAKIL